jgi:hypothetical protein
VSRNHGRTAAPLVGIIATGVDNLTRFTPPVAAVQQSDEKPRNAFTDCRLTVSFT